MKTIRLVDKATGNTVAEYKDTEAPRDKDRIQLLDYRVVTVTEWRPRTFILTGNPMRPDSTGRVGLVEVYVED